MIGEARAVCDDCGTAAVVHTARECAANLRRALTAAEERAQRAGVALAEAIDGRERLSPHDLLARGGEWLGAARPWLQWHTRNGECVTWGSADVIEHNFTVAQIEQLAADVAAAAMRPQPSEDRLSAMLRARWAAEAERDEARTSICPFCSARGKYLPQVCRTCAASLSGDAETAAREVALRAIAERDEARAELAAERACHEECCKQADAARHAALTEAAEAARSFSAWLRKVADGAPDAYAAHEAVVAAEGVDGAVLRILALLTPAAHCPAVVSPESAAAIRDIEQAARARITPAVDKQYVAVSKNGETLSFYDSLDDAAEAGRREFRTRFLGAREARESDRIVLGEHANGCHDGACVGCVDVTPTAGGGDRG